MFMNLVICILSFSSSSIFVKGFVAPNAGFEINRYANIQDRFNDFFTQGTVISTTSSTPPPPSPPLPSFLSFDLPFLDQDIEDQQQPGEFDKFVSPPQSDIPMYGSPFPSEKLQQSILSQQSDEEMKEAVFETIKLLGP
eukprot:TRINITY_DN5147_c1_g1_i2.p1 TRINITY_DN5147_c1_g1~~TRINITY_DN5147_c1_g1_i2.p1  ORF type:complete len:139 (+),score=17.07 TRINITY_DN5147_c1_g1_i2:342-758(+)